MLDIPSPPIPLDEFRVSYETGFLPINIDINNKKLPLHRLSNPYFSPWEDIISDLPQLIQTGDIRQKVLALPVLSVENLDANDETEWQRAYLVLAFLTHAYIWGGEKAEDKLPPSISRPFLAVSAHLELPPCATYAALNLWNFTTRASESSTNDKNNEDNIDLTNPDNIYTINSFTGTDDERWFLVVSVAMEACGAKMIRLVLDSITTINTTTTADDGDGVTTESTSNRNTILTNLLSEMGECIDELGRILERMYERNDPMVFYHQIRPLLAGSKNMGAAGLPNGVFYDTGDNQGRWHQYSGGSNAQSSLVQLIDIALGVQHIASGDVEGSKTSKDKHTAFMKEMRNYMPGPHRRFLEYIASIANIRPYALSLPASSDVRQAYNAVVMKLGGFRDKHIQIVSRYIILPASRPTPESSKYKDVMKNRVNLASATSETAADSGNKPREEKVFYGTGGTDLIPFLKATRDETKAAARFID